MAEECNHHEKGIFLFIKKGSFIGVEMLENDQRFQQNALVLEDTIIGLINKENYKNFL